MKKWIIISVISAAVIAGVVWFFIARKEAVTINLTRAESTEVQITVTATGYVQPVDEIMVGTQVSGVIEKLHVDFNSVVKKGQLLAELDKSILKQKLSQARSTLATARGNLDFYQKNYDRTKRLFDAKALPQTDLETATMQLIQARTALASAESDLSQAQINLSYADIYSPIDGVVQNRAVDEGQTVAASFNTPTLFTIANDLTKMEVQANVDEADVGGIKLNQKVTFTVGSYPDEIFGGEVTQIRLQPVTTNNVVTYSVIIEAPNPDYKLFPGMTANISIVVDQAAGLTLPVEALRLRIAPDVIKHIKTKPLARKGENTRTVWLQTGKDQIEERGVETGISDGINTIIRSGIDTTDQVVLSILLKKNNSNSKSPAANPLMPRRPPGR